VADVRRAESAWDPSGLADGVPDAAVLRIWRAVPEDERVVQELVVFKVTPSGFCRIASVDAGRPDAYASRERKPRSLRSEDVEAMVRNDNRRN
jgi:hypothetical protein